MIAVATEKSDLLADLPDRRPVAEAHRLAELGFPTFPCVAGTKQPATMHGCLDATTDAAQIEQRWSMWPEHNVAVATAGLLVVDVDPVDGRPNPWLTLERLDQFAHCPQSITPRGGRHFWFRAPDGSNLRNTASKIAPGVDTRANGGYVLVAPSRTEHGRYEWVPGSELDCSPGVLPLPPSWLLALLATPKPERIGTATAQDEIPEGCRNNTLTSQAGELRRMGLSENAILGALLSINAERCNPPLGEDEVRKIAWSVSRYEPDQLTVAVAENWAAQDADDDDAEDVSKDPGALPDDIWEVPGFIGDVIRWNLETAHRPQPALALAGTIALFGAITGRKITDRLKTRTNVYTLGIGHSGAGKDHARNVNKEILQRANMEVRIGPESIASGAGLVVAVDAQREILIQIDEIGRFLQTVGNPNSAPHLYQIITVLLKLFTSSGTLFVGDAYADAKKIKRIDQPHLCLHGTSVAKSFFDSLSEESLTDGFVGRLLVFESSPGNRTEADDESDSRDIADFVPPDSILDDARWWRSFEPGGNLGSANPQPRKLIDSADAKLIFRELSSVAKSHPEESVKAAIWVRAHEKARKLALMYAVSEQREAVEISADAASWGCAVVRHLTKRLEYLADRHVADGAFGKASLRVLRLIEDAGRNGISRNLLCQRTRGLKPRERAEIIESLNQQGKLACNLARTGGPTKCIYVSSRFKTDST